MGVGWKEDLFASLVCCLDPEGKDRKTWVTGRCWWCLGGNKMVGRETFGRVRDWKRGDELEGA